VHEEDKEILALDEVKDDIISSIIGRMTTSVQIVQSKMELISSSTTFVEWETTHMKTSQ
jgi:hypothetical protein